MSSRDGVFITNNHSKQRSDKINSKFLIQRSKETNFADIIEMYVGAVKSDLGKVSGQVFRLIKRNVSSIFLWVKI